MPKVFSFLLFFFPAVLLTPFLCAAAAPADAPATLSPTADVCTLPAPNNLVVTEVGTTYISVAWDPVSGASKYRVKVKDLTTGIEVGDQLVTATTFTQNLLTGGHNYRFRVYSVCSNEEESAAYAEVEQSTIIIDLILQASNYNSAPQYICSGGYSPSQQPVVCTFNYETGYAFWLEVRAAGTNMLARYKAEVQSDGNILIGRVPATSYQSLPNVHTYNQSGLEPASLGDTLVSEKINVMSNASFACEITVAHHNNTGYIYGWPTFSYEFAVLNPSPPPSGGGGGSGNGGVKNIRPADQPDAAQEASETGADTRDDDTPKEDDGPTLVVNPFSARLDVFLSAAGQSATTLRLFSADGRLAAQQSYPAGTVQCSLSTEGLPNGFYLLWVEKAGKREVFKVVKRE